VSGAFSKTFSKTITFLRTTITQVTVRRSRASRASCLTEARKLGSRGEGILKTKNKKQKTKIKREFRSPPSSARVVTSPSYALGQY